MFWSVYSYLLPQVELYGMYTADLVPGLPAILNGEKFTWLIQQSTDIRWISYQSHELCIFCSAVHIWRKGIPGKYPDSRITSANRTKGADRMLAGWVMHPIHGNVISRLQQPPGRSAGFGMLSDVICPLRRRGYRKHQAFLSLPKPCWHPL